MTSRKDSEEYSRKNDKEMERLEQLYPVLKQALGGQLLMPPIDLSAGKKRILDSGTANGHWLRDLSTTLSSDNEYIGTDIDPSVFPKNALPNHTFHVQDINAPWPEEWADSFDVVHQRSVLHAAGANMHNAVANLARMVKPGGWIQLMEAGLVTAPDNGPAMRQLIQLTQDIFVAIGAGTSTSRDLRAWIEEAGFVDVHDELFNMRLGARNPDGKLGEQTAYATATTAAGMIASAKSLPSGFTSISEIDLGSLADRLRTELLEQGADYPMRCVWARKPIK